MKVRSLFDKIEEKEIDKFIKNPDVKRIYFEKNRIISSDLDNQTIGLIVNGEAFVERYDYNGNRFIIEKLEKNSLFGNCFYNLKNDINVTATSDCEVLFFSYNYLFKKNKNTIIISNFLELSVNKNLNLNIHLNLLSKRNIKDKLLTYFRILSAYKKNKTFILPWTYTDLADYLAIDRSAMMREIARLKKEGYLKTDNKKITLINY